MNFIWEGAYLPRCPRRSAVHLVGLAIAPSLDVNASVIRKVYWGVQELEPRTAESTPCCVCGLGVQGLGVGV